MVNGISPEEYDDLESESDVPSHKFALTAVDGMPTLHADATCAEIDAIQGAVFVPVASYHNPAHFCEACASEYIDEQWPEVGETDV